MVSREIEDKFNSAFDLGVVALGTTVISAILLFTPGKMVGYLGMGAGIGSFIASSAAKRKLAACGDDLISDILSQKNKEIVSKTDEIDRLTIEHKALKERTDKVVALGTQALSLQESLQSLQRTSSSQTSEIETLKEQLSQSLESGNADLKSIKESAKTAIQERYEGLLLALQGFGKRKEYQLSQEKIEKLKNDADEILERYFSHLSETLQIEDICNLLHGAIDELANTKVRAINSYSALRIADLNRIVTDLERINAEWQTAKLVPLAAYEKLKADCVAQLKEFHLDATSQLKEVWEQAQDLERSLPEDEKFFDRLKGQLQEYERKLVEANKPHRFVGRAEQAQVGNTLIDYYLRSGLILDAIDWYGTELGYKLMFHFGRNGVYISPDQLHENNAREQIKSMTSSLSLPEFKQSERGGHLYLEVQQRLPQKKDNVKETQRILMDLDKGIEKVIASLSDKPSVRIMGATGEGKGVMARYLLNRILTSNNWYTRLHDPQDGSSEDYWGIPKVSTSGSQLSTALSQIEAQMLQRENEKNWTVPTLDILDEIDTHLDKKEKKDSFIDLISRIRHLGMKLILIGQNPKVGRAGFEWSDMQQMTCIYMGASSFDAIITNPQLKPKESVLTKQYTQLSEYFEELNDGLDGGEKHLFGLVVIPGKTPFWVELPRPDLIEVVCDSKLLGKVFSIPNSLIEFVERKNSAKTPSNSANTIDISTSTATSETLVNKGMATIDGTSDYAGVGGTTGKTVNSGKATCKKHPDVELTQSSDGRHYCKSCKKRVPKSQVEYR